MTIDHLCTIAGQERNACSDLIHFQEATDRDTIALAEQRATRRLLFTSFESCDLETAERLRLHIPRIRLRNGVRTCDIEPSNYLQELNLGIRQTSGPTDQSHPSA